MKRNLTDKEKQLTEKGIKKIEKEVKDLKSNLEYNLAVIEKQNYMRDFEDKWKPFLRKQKDDEDDQLINQLKQTIEMKEKTLKNMEIQLKEGVESSNTAVQ